MKLPTLVKPVKRPEVIPTHLVVDIVGAYQESPDEEREEYNKIVQDLRFGANFNDPHYFKYRTYQQLKYSSCGCGCFQCLTGASCR